MRIKVEIAKCVTRWCNGTPVIVRCLVYDDHKHYQGYCKDCSGMAILIDHRDYLLTPEQAQLEIIKHKL
jgi:hypothetical protein